MEKGYIQVYTGNGKGKTTAALGLALRSLCAGRKVFFGQFMKGQSYSELRAALYFDKLTMEQFGQPHFIRGKASVKDAEDAKKGLLRMRDVISSGEYDLVVMDEINTAMHFRLLDIEEVLQVLNAKSESTELVLTGRYAPSEIVDKADLVTEMREIKHYYNAGIKARVGIEN